MPMVPRKAPEFSAPPPSERQKLKDALNQAWAMHLRGEVGAQEEGEPRDYPEGDSPGFMQPPPWGGEPLMVTPKTQHIEKPPNEGGQDRMVKRGKRKAPWRGEGS